MNPEESEPTDDQPPMDRWAIPLYESPSALPIPMPVSEAEYPLRIESMPVEGFHPKLNFYRSAG